MARKLCCRLAVAALLAPAMTGAQSAPVRHCVLLEPGVVGHVPVAAIFSQLTRPTGGDGLRVVLGDVRLADVTLAPRPGLRGAQILAVARLIRRPIASAPPQASPQWRPEPEQCSGGMPAHMLAVGSVTDAPPPGTTPSVEQLPRVTLLDLPVSGATRQLGPWRQAWSQGTEVFVLPLAAPVLAASPAKAD